MAAARSPRATNRRGSPEAIEKRRVARLFNEALGGEGAAATKLDGRSEKRRRRLLRELKDNKARGARALKPLEVLGRVQELLELGEPVISIRKARRLPRACAKTAALVELVRRLHDAYEFRPECYRFVGIGDDVLGAAGVLRAASARRTAR